MLRISTSRALSNHSFCLGGYSHEKSIPERRHVVAYQVMTTYSRRGTELARPHSARPGHVLELSLPYPHRIRSPCSSGARGRRFVRYEWPICVALACQQHRACHNWCAACRRNALVPSLAGVKVLTVGSHTHLEMSHHRKVRRVVVTRHQPPFRGHPSSRGESQNQLVRPGTPEHRTAAADHRTCRRHFGMMPEHAPMLRCTARRCGARQTEL